MERIDRVEQDKGDENFESDKLIPWDVKVT